MESTARGRKCDRGILHHQLTECTALKEPRQIFTCQGTIINCQGAMINCRGTIFNHQGAFCLYPGADVKNSLRMQDLLGHNN